MHTREPDLGVDDVDPQPDPDTATPPATRARFDIGLVLAVLVFPIVAVLRLRLPGPNYDEMLYTNAALGPVDDWFVQARWFGQPALLMPYIGALKAWVAYPYFTVFGFSIESARLLGIAIATCGLSVLVHAVRRFGRPVALATALLLATSPSLVELVRVDVGPSAVEFAVRCAGIAIVVPWLGRRATLRGSVLLSVVFVVGTFNKLNFLWSIAALVVIVLIGVPGVVRQTREMLIIAAGGAASIGLYAWSRATYGEVSGTSFPELDGIGDRVTVLRQTMDGTWFRLWTSTSDDLPVWRWAVLLLVVALVTAGTVLAVRQRNRTFLALLGGAAVGPALMLLTGGAVRGWHAFVVFPLVAVVAAAPALRASRAVRSGVLAGVLLLVISQAALLAWLTSTRGDAIDPTYTTAIYEVAEITARETAPVLLTDWGMKGYLQAADHRPIYVEAFWYGAPALCHNLVVVRSVGYEFFPGTRDAALALAPMHLETVVNDNEGIPRFDLYRIDTCQAS